MKCVFQQTAILVCAFFFVSTEKCQRRVCNIRMSRSEIFFKIIFINPIYCTHVILYTAEVIPNQEIDLQGPKYREQVPYVLDLKKQNPNLKTIFAVRNVDRYYYKGPIPLTAEFIKMYTTDSLRSNFIRNIIKFVRDLNIEGVKIDTQTAEGGNKEKFTQLIKDLKTAIEEESAKTKRPRLILSVGIPADKTFLDKYYDVLAISKLVDMIDLATYNFHDDKQCSNNPIHHSPLYVQDPSSTRTIDFMSRYVAQLVGSKDKINVGLSKSALTHMRSASCGYYSQEYHSSYGMMCGDYIKVFYGAKHYKLEKEVGRFVTWWSDRYRSFYDDPDTLRNKVNYIIRNGFSGVIISFADGDYRECNQGPYPLLKAVYDECRK